MAPPEPEYLSSGVMNYLVFRYLNEAGFLRAADTLRQSWLGPNSTTADAHNKPYARGVGRHTLVHLAQDGLFLNHIESRARKTAPRFSFNLGHEPSYSFQRDEGRPDFNSYAEPMRKRKASAEPEVELERNVEEDVEMPVEIAPRKSVKRKRKSGNDRPPAPIVNGDTGDTDSGDAVQPPTMEPSPEPMEIESKPMSPIMTTDEIGLERSTSVEAPPQDLTTATTYLQTDSDVAVLEWSPDRPGTLFAGSTSQAKMYNVGTDAVENGTEPTSASIGFPGQASREVGHFVWTLPDQGVMTVSEPADNYDPHLPVSTQLIGVGEDPKESCVLATIPGFVTTLQYEPSSNRLMCLSVNLDKTLLQIWDISYTPIELLGRKRLEADEALADIAWLDSNTALACGSKSIHKFELSDEGIFSTTQIDSSSAFPPAIRIRVEQLHKRMSMVLSTDMRSKTLYSHDDSVQGASHSCKLQSPNATEHSDVVDFQFEPSIARSHCNPAEARGLAIAYSNGDVELWACSMVDGPDSHEDMIRGSLVQIFSIGSATIANALTFSPDGFFLAVASFNNIKIWALSPRRYDISTDVKTNGINGHIEDDSRSPPPCAIWNRKGLSDEKEGVLDVAPTAEDDLDWTHSLNWGMSTNNSNGKLAYGVRNRIAIIDV